MPITLGTNIASVRAQRQLLGTSDQLGSVFERLSSGQRINRASDDAAGLSIADSLRADQRIYTRGVRNLNDGLSLLNIADGAIDNLSGIMVRLQELAEQSANGVYSNQQRSALDNEAQALSEEYIRIARSTEFNGQKLFTGDTPVVNLQAGVGTDAVLSTSVGGAIGTGSFQSAATYFEAGAVINSDIADVNYDGYLDIVYSTLTTSNVALGSADGTFSDSELAFALGIVETTVLDDFNADGNIDILATNNTEIIFAAGNGDGTFESPVTSSATWSIEDVTTGDFNGDGIIDIATTSQSNSRFTIQTGNGDGTFTETDVEIMASAEGASVGDFNGDGYDDLVVASAAQAAIYLSNGDGTLGTVRYAGGVNGSEDTAVGDLDGDGNLDIVLSEDNNTIEALYGNGDGTFETQVVLSASISGEISIVDFNGDGENDLVIGDNSVSVLLGEGGREFGSEASYALDVSGFLSTSMIVADINDDGVLDISQASATSGLQYIEQSTVAGISPLLEFSLETQSDAKLALPYFQRELERLSEQRGQIGSYMARINVAENVLSVTVENYTSAESRIRDADIAQEAADLARLNILQQAGAAVLSQANSQPQLALSLLT